MMACLRNIGLALALAAWIALPGSSTAQQAPAPNPEVEALQDEVRKLQEGQKEILKRLEALQKAVEQSGPRRRRDEPFKGAEISIAGAPAKGSAEAGLVMIEFSDYQCPFCRRFSAGTLPRIMRDYVETGKLRYVFHDFPIARIHPAATDAAVAARCAGAQGKYWEMHDRFFAHQKSLAARDWPAHAEAVGLEPAAFGACMADAGVKRAVRRSTAIGRKAGVTGTPAFYLGTLSADGKTVKATERIRGARPFAAFKQAIDRLLEKTPG